jgi:hypothetical protein
MLCVRKECGFVLPRGLLPAVDFVPFCDTSLFSEAFVASGGLVRGFGIVFPPPGLLGEFSGPYVWKQFGSLFWDQRCNLDIPVDFFHICGAADTRF